MGPADSPLLNVYAPAVFRSVNAANCGEVPRPARCRRVLRKRRSLFRQKTSSAPRQFVCAAAHVELNRSDSNRIDNRSDNGKYYYYWRGKVSKMFLQTRSLRLRITIGLSHGKGSGCETELGSIEQFVAMKDVFLVLPAEVVPISI